MCLLLLPLGACEETLPASQRLQPRPSASEPESQLPKLQTARVDATLPLFERRGGLAGKLTSAGSDTLGALMAGWSEAFARQYPGVAIQVQAAGSSTAPPALTEGTAELGPMSRRMTATETEAFRRRFGYAPLPLQVALDALAIYVHKDNPLPALSLPELDAIYSSTRRCGQAQPIRYWGDLRLPGSWTRRPIQRFGRNSVSGTYGYFKRVALCGGDVLNRVNEQPGSASVVQAVASSLNGIGYSGLGFQTSGVRALPISALPTSAPVGATYDAVARGDYPLARPLYLYVNKAPDAPLPALPRAFLAFVLSREGQALVARSGYVPLLAAQVQRERLRGGL